MSDATLRTCLLPPDGSLLEAAAAQLLGAAGESGDLSGHLVLVSSLPLAAELRAALARVAGRPLLLPHFDTLRRWATAAPFADLPTPMPDSERLVLLHTALAARRWLDERALWGISSELAALSDELSAAAVRLPENLDALQAQLEAAYALRGSAPLAFEARLVHEMWRVLAASGRPDAPSAYRLRLARLASSLSQPLFVLVDGPVDERLAPAERDFLLRCAERCPVTVCAPLPRAAGTSPLARLLAAAWPEEALPSGMPPLRERAAALAKDLPASPLAGRLQLMPVRGREAEAEAVAAVVCRWLGEGLRRIALVAEDRLTARRVRALLERREVLVADETGWKMTTTRAAAGIDALLETVAGGAYHLDVLDLFKSPFCFADLPAATRSEAVLMLERAIRRSGVRAGVAAFRHALLDQPSGETRETALQLLDRLQDALRTLSGKPAPLARWMARLQQALRHLGADAALAADAAGGEVLELLAERQRELAGSDAVFAFSAWRDWLNRELEAGAFRDRSIVSSIVLLPRHDVRLRRFEAAVVIGADAGQLAPVVPGGSFFNQAVRRELGLPTRIEAERALRRDLELLLSVVPRVVVTWQHERDGEAQLLSPEFDLLSSLHRLAWGDDLHRPPPVLDAGQAPAAETAPTPPVQARPTAPLGQVPVRLPVGGLSSLVACPYQFFARHVLALGELDEVTDEMEKSDYGRLVHRSLERFHAANPRVSALSDEAALAALDTAVREVFAEAEADNWLAVGWRLRCQQRLPAYLHWQRAREAAGWVWQAAESRVARSFALPDGGSVELYGRIDRIDAGPDGLGLIDFKTRSVNALKKSLDEDVQLPAYALLVDGAVEAAYVSLDDERVEAVACADDLDAAAAAQGERLVRAFADLRGGTALPAHGVDAVCRWCEMAGLCRRDHVAEA
jgi:ATP-dependent helicase/nuclease subunit B